MTLAPYLLPKMRGGARLGHAQVVDHMFLDGLEDAYDRGRLMGTFAEDCAEAFQFTRADQDAYALGSLENALRSPALRRLRPRDRARHRHHPQGRHHGLRGRTAEDRPPRQDPDAEARLPQGRHRHRRQLLLDLRRRGGPDPRLRLRLRDPRPRPARPPPRPCLPRPGPGSLHDRPGAGGAQAPRPSRLDAPTTSTSGK